MKRENIGWEKRLTNQANFLARICRSVEGMVIAKEVDMRWEIRVRAKRWNM